MGVNVKLLDNSNFPHLSAGSVYTLKGNSLFAKGNFIMIVKAEDVIKYFQMIYLDSEYESIRIQLSHIINKHKLSKRFVAKSLNVNYNNLVTYLTGYKKNAFTTRERFEQFTKFINSYNEADNSKPPVD